MSLSGLCDWKGEKNARDQLNNECAAETSGTFRTPSASGGKQNLSDSAARDVAPTLDPADAQANASAHKSDVSLTG